MSANSDDLPQVTGGDEETHKDDDDHDRNVPSADGAVCPKSASCTSGSSRKKPTKAPLKRKHSMSDDQYHMLMNRLVHKYPESDADCAELYGSNVALLNPGRNLNHEMIRFALKYTMRNKLSREMSDSILLLDSNFGDLDRFVGMNKKKRIRFFEKYLLTSDKKYLVFPANYEDQQVGSNLKAYSHWFLVVVTEFEELFDPVELKSIFNATVVYLNSDYDFGIEKYQRIQSGIIAYLSALNELYHGETKEVALRSRRPTVPQQSNDHDCGLFTIQFFEHFFTNQLARAYLLGLPSHRVMRYADAFSEFDSVKISRRKRTVWREIVFDMLMPSVREALREAIKIEAKKKVPYNAKKAKPESPPQMASAHVLPLSLEIPLQIINPQAMAKMLENHPPNLGANSLAVALANPTQLIEAQALAIALELAAASDWLDPELIILD